ncbi:DUF2332 family protein [Novosphingobium sp. G106]|uniref:DUF2332 domain-containing protein n=1 Tax=Novosphingobium sp. G106 TaxID=2849500 RepID=UPI002811C369|nr:DUF2332 family protein [Novosphingobium sp. G106]
MTSTAILRTELGESHGTARAAPPGPESAPQTPVETRDAVTRDGRAELLRQSGIARDLGSPFVSEVLAAAWRQLDRAPRLAALVSNWPGDPAAAAMAMRLNAGLHALARRGALPDLSALYAGLHANFGRAIGAALEVGEETILEWMDHPTQTNEVGRSAAFMAALMTLADGAGMPFELLEFGASAGLNLMLDRYAHDLGGVGAGTPDSPVRVSPEWRGAAVVKAPVQIHSVRGVDLRPLRLEDPFTRERLLSYIWADHPARAERLCHAIALNLARPPQIERASAAPWLAHQLTQPQREGVCRVVMHSMVLQYLPEAERRAALTSIMAAGARATPDRPFAWIGLEWNSDRTEVQLRLTRWPGEGGETGTSRVLALCHAYGSWIDWRG